MHDSSHIFADRLVNIAVTGPLVRIELSTIQLPTAEGQKPRLQLFHYLSRLRMDWLVAPWARRSLREIERSGRLGAQLPHPVQRLGEDFAKNRQGRLFAVGPKQGLQLGDVVIVIAFGDGQQLAEFALLV